MPMTGLLRTPAKVICRFSEAALTWTSSRMYNSFRS
jgi:hypothetical protein